MQQSDRQNLFDPLTWPMNLRVFHLGRCENTFFASINSCGPDPMSMVVWYYRYIDQYQLIPPSRMVPTLRSSELAFNFATFRSNDWFCQSLDNMNSLAEWSVGSGDKDYSNIDDADHEFPTHCWWMLTGRLIHGCATMPHRLPQIELFWHWFSTLIFSLALDIWRNIEYLELAAMTGSWVSHRLFKCRPFPMMVISNKSSATIIIFRYHFLTW